MDRHLTQAMKRQAYISYFATIALSYNEHNTMRTEAVVAS